MRWLFLCRFSDAGTSALVRPLRRCGLSASMVVADRTVRNSSRWQAVRAPQLAKRRRIHHRPRRSTKSFLVRRKSPTSVWRRSMSSTRKLDHHRSSKNQGWPSEAVPAVAVASDVPTGRNLHSLQRQRSRHSIERRSLCTARTKSRPAQPPQSSFTRQAYNVPVSSPSKSN